MLRLFGPPVRLPAILTVDHILIVFAPPVIVDVKARGDGQQRLGGLASTEGCHEVVPGAQFVEAAQHAHVPGQNRLVQSSGEAEGVASVGGNSRERLLSGCHRFAPGESR